MKKRPIHKKLIGILLIFNSFFSVVLLDKGFLPEASTISQDKRFISTQASKPQSCKLKVRYTIDKVDPKFNISQAEFSELVHKAANEWNNSINQTVLIHNTNPNTNPVKYSMQYDDSQDTITRLYNNNGLLQIFKNKNEEQNNIRLGTYIETRTPQSLTREVKIFAFATESDLYATILHEMGHTLGIDHLEDSNSVMSAETKDLFSQPNKLTQSDINALKLACK